MFGIIFSTNTNLIPGEMQNRSGGVVLAISLTTNMAILTALWRISCERLWVFLFRTINIYIFCNYIYNITYIHIYISQYLQEHGARWIICGFTDAVKRSWCIFGPPDPRAMASCYCAASINPFNIVFLFQIRWIYVNLQIDPVIVLVLANSHQIPFFFSS